MASGAMLMLASPLWLVIAGLVVATAGFFAAHSIASGWVGALATEGKAQAGGMYNLFFYAGISGIGWVGGTIYHAWGWTWVIVMILVGLALVVTTTFTVLAGRRG
jgi:predicted MFS family arabinose efflux permease